MAACNKVACKVTTAFNNTSWFAQQLQNNEPSGNHDVSYNTTTYGCGLATFFRELTHNVPFANCTCAMIRS